MLSSDERRELLDLARETVKAAAAGDPLPEPEPSEGLKGDGAAFVSLFKGGDLRGCIGHIHAHGPLWKSVREMARAAALEDNRFSPVRPEEVDALKLDISVLTPMRRISGMEEIKVGRDGLYIRKGGYTGLLLPQVATKYGWDAKRFFEQTCIKAQLPAIAWQDDEAEIYAFEAEIIEEDPSPETLG